MALNKKIPCIILNGFLGSGKTTLFRNLLTQSKQKDINVVAIVNDMSELDVDGEILGNTDIIEENQSKLESIYSCVISSKLGIKKLDEALKKLLASNNPDLILIETSGSSHPMPLIAYFKHHNTVKLNGVFALVDCLMLAHDYNYGKQIIPILQHNIAEQKRDTVNLLAEQILFCDHLILTKADRIKEEKVLEIATAVQDINPYTSVYSVFFGNLGLETLLELNEYDYFKVEQLIKELKPVLENEAQADKPYNLATRVIKDDRPFHPQRLWDVCHKYLNKKIYRSKGFFWLASRDKHSLLWNQAAGGINLELIGSWKSGILEDENHNLLDFEIKELEASISNTTGRFGDRHCDLTIIGDAAYVDKFTEAINTCFLNDKEISDWANGYEFNDPWPKKIAKVKG